MSKHSILTGRVRLRHDAKFMPEQGLRVPRLRVEITEQGKTDEAWIAELIVEGDMPWCRGEERKVELRIMSDEFRNHIIQSKPTLLVKYGSEILGYLEFKD